MSRIPKVYCQTCGGKRLYRNENQARDSLAKARRESPEMDRPDDYALNIYRCPVRKMAGKAGWHIGHNPATVRLIEKAVRDGTIKIEQR